MATPQRIIIVSNRLPLTVTKQGGQYHFDKSAGGLVSGLKTYLDSLGNHGKKLKYLWVGWPGIAMEEKSSHALTTKLMNEFHYYPVFLKEKTIEKFYYGFCNGTLWPLFHYFPSYTTYDENHWMYYKRVNEIFRDAVLKVLKPGDIIWVQDYQLMLLPQLLHEEAPEVPIGFFLHIPFPDYEIFRLLPRKWRRSLVDGLLGADLVGFHTHDYTQNFLQAALRIFGYENSSGVIQFADHAVKVDTFPMGIDFERFYRASKDPDVIKEYQKLKQDLGGRKAVLSIDRLDYTKGILNRLYGYELFLEENPRWRRKVTLVLSVVPSRDRVGKYEEMKNKIDEAVGRINGKFGGISWTPILYQYKSLGFAQVAAHYLMSDAALVTPLRDGMNLVAKEYIATHADKKGVLILSEMAGTAKELGEALLINPNYHREITDALKEALEMPEEEQSYRMGLMQTRLKRHNVTRWANEFIETLRDFKNEELRLFAYQENMPELREKFRKEFRTARKRLLFLDYDGTLIPFSNLPQLTKPTETVISLLKHLSSKKRNEVVLASGRDKRTLERWFGNLPINLIAEHGGWIKKKGKEWKMLPSLTAEFKNEFSPLLIKIVPTLERYTDRLLGSFIEEKEFSLAWHYRNASPDLGPQRAQELIDELKGLVDSKIIQVVHGSKVVEVRPLGITKGAAGKEFLRNGFAPGKDTLILAIGDDHTDEDLFAALPRTAYTVRVGKARSRARLFLPNVSQVIQLLKEIAPL